MSETHVTITAPLDPVTLVEPPQSTLLTLVEPVDEPAVVVASPDTVTALVSAPGGNPTVEVVEPPSVPVITVPAGAGPQGVPGPQGEAGPEGPQGPAGDAEALSYTHNQMTASATWHIEHNLGFYPGGVTVKTSAGNIAVGHIQYVDENIIVLHFSSGFAGRAFVS